MTEYAQDNTYVLDPDLLEEMHRLDIQGKMFTRGMGGLLPERPDFHGIKKVLDLGCGSAEWVLELAKNHPEIQAIGVDKAPRMIEFASARAYKERLNNAKFRICDITEPLPFPKASFDLVNARLLRAFMSVTSWPVLIQQCWRVLRPGGLVRFTEDELMLTNSRACDRLNFIGYKNFATIGKGFSLYHPGIMMRMPYWLAERGFQSIATRSSVIDISYGAEAYHSFSLEFRLALQLIKPFLLQMNPEYTLDEVDDLLEQVAHDIQLPTFAGRLYLATVVGEKRLPEA